jgi:hypothetical protein
MAACITLVKTSGAVHRPNGRALNWYAVVPNKPKVSVHLSRGTFPYSTGLISSSTGKVSESLFESSSVSVSENSYCSPIFTTAKSFEFR